MKLKVLSVPNKLLIGSLLSLFLSSHSYAEPAPLQQELPTEKVFIADIKKSNLMIQEGLITGGDRLINGVIVKEIRHSIHTGYERVVVDLQANINGEEVAIERAPYFQVEVSPYQKRLGVSIWGNPRLSFSAQKVNQIFKKSKIISAVQLYPKLEDEVWTFELPLKSEASVEVFELKNPLRLIIDLKKKSNS